MGTFHQPIELAAGREGPFETMEALVDTGATYTLVPASILRRLGVEPTDSLTFIIADGSRMQQDIGEASPSGSTDASARRSWCLATKAPPCCWAPTHWKRSRWESIRGIAS